MASKFCAQRGDLVKAIQMSTSDLSEVPASAVFFGKTEFSKRKPCKYGSNRCFRLLPKHLRRNGLCLAETGRTGVVNFETKKRQLTT
jgi:hypothetical protein